MASEFISPTYLNIKLWPKCSTVHIVLGACTIVPSSAVYNPSCSAAPPLSHHFSFTHQHEAFGKCKRLLPISASPKHSRSHHHSAVFDTAECQSDYVLNIDYMSIYWICVALSCFGLFSLLRVQLTNHPNLHILFTIIINIWIPFWQWKTQPLIIQAYIHTHHTWIWIWPYEQSQ